MGKIRKELVLNGVIKCPICEVKNRLFSWEDYTVERCNSREKRRAYVSLSLEKAYKKKTDCLYICPSCNEYIEGYRLKVQLEEPQN